MRILIVPDSFKGSLSSIQVGQQLQAGLQSVLPDAEFRLLPVADGKGRRRQDHRIHR